MTSEQFKQELSKYINPQKAKSYQWFFKTGNGEYGEGDKFLGVVIPDIRKVVKRNYKQVNLEEAEKLLHSKFHEHRMAALLIFVLKLRSNKLSEQESSDIYDIYLRNTQYINNWDLVDVSARDIVGQFIINKDRSILYKLAKSKLLWEQRISIIATAAFIRHSQLDDTFKLAQEFINHKHDLMHKATGWMLREAGKKDKKRLEDFLEKYASKMPRTMLRYSIEKFTDRERKYYMTMKS